MEEGLNVFISNSPRNTEPQALLSPTTLSNCNSMLTVVGVGELPALQSSPSEHRHRAIAPELNWGTLPCPICPGTSSSAPWPHCWEQLPAPGPGSSLNSLLVEVTTALGDTQNAPGVLAPGGQELFAEWRLSSCLSPNLQQWWAPVPGNLSNRRTIRQGLNETLNHKNTNTHYYRMCFPPYFLIITLTRANGLVITGRDFSVVCRGRTDDFYRRGKEKFKQPKETTKKDTAGGLLSFYTHWFE